MYLYIRLHFVYDRIFFCFLSFSSHKKKKLKENHLKIRRCACWSAVGGCWVGNVCNALFLTVRIQVDSCPFRSTQRHYCAFDSALVLLLTQSPVRSVPAGGRSEHPEIPLSQRKPRAAEHVGSPPLPLCLAAAQWQQLGAISSCLWCTGE